MGALVWFLSFSVISFSDIFCYFLYPPERYPRLVQTASPIQFRFGTKNRLLQQTGWESLDFGSGRVSTRVTENDRTLNGGSGMVSGSFCHFIFCDFLLFFEDPPECYPRLVQTTSPIQFCFGTKNRPLQQTGWERLFGDCLEVTWMLFGDSLDCS